MATNMTYIPYRAINELQQQMQRLFSESAGQAARAPEQGWSPVVDIFETEEELVLHTELPGMEQSDFHLSIDNGVLTLTGERKLGDQAKQFKAHRQERPM